MSSKKCKSWLLSPVFILSLILATFTGPSSYAESPGGPASDVIFSFVNEAGMPVDEQTLQGRIDISYGNSSGESFSVNSEKPPWIFRGIPEGSDVYVGVFISFSGYFSKHLDIGHGDNRAITVTLFSLPAVGEGTISGRVSSMGQALPDAEVMAEFESANGSASFSVRADDSGEFLLSGLYEGSYRIAVYSLGHM